MAQQQVGRPTAPDPDEQLLGPPAEAVLDAIEANTQPSKQARAIWEETQKEILEGRAEALVDRQGLLARFGWGVPGLCLALSSGSTVSGG